MYSSRSTYESSYNLVPGSATRAVGSFWVLLELGKPDVPLKLGTRPFFVWPFDVDGPATVALSGLGLGDIVCSSSLSVSFMSATVSSEAG
jgi:hypothetical protein